MPGRLEVPTGGQEIPRRATGWGDRVGLALADLVDVYPVEAGRELTTAGCLDGDGGVAVVNSNFAIATAVPSGALRWVVMFGDAAGAPSGFPVPDGAGDPVQIAGVVPGLDDGGWFDCTRSPAPCKWPAKAGTVRTWQRRHCGDRRA